MPRFKLTLEYAGTRYSGWQVQRNARTVQGEIDRAVRAAVPHRGAFELYGSGRTDAGVHALAQVAHLDIATTLPPDQVRWRVNDELPSDINVLSVVPVSRRFHARHGAVARSYLYQVSRRRTAFAKPFVWWVKDALDAAAMREAGRLFLGRKNFESFTADDPEETSTVVEIERLDLQEEGDLILVRVEGSHFIWRMVRRMVGVMVEVGRGGVTPDDVARFLQRKSEVPARLTAPPSGLFLERVFYEGDSREGRPLRPVIDVPAGHGQP